MPFLKKDLINLPECPSLWVLFYFGTNTDLGLFWDSLLKLMNGNRLMFYASVTLSPVFVQMFLTTTM